MTRHFNDPYIAAIYKAISESNAGLTRDELLAEHPEDEDHPGQLREAINDLTNRNAIHRTAGRYYAETDERTALAAPPKTKPLFTGLLAPVAETSKEKAMKKAMQYGGVREAVRAQLADGPKTVPEIANGCKLSVRQVEQAVYQLTNAGEFTRISGGGRSGPGRYALTSKTPGKDVIKTARKAEATPRQAPPEKAPKRAAALVPVVVRDEAPIVAMQATGAILVVDQATNAIQTIPPNVVEQIFALAALRG